MTPIEFIDVSKRYGPVTALDGIDLTIDAGAIHALTGPNGSGKTTVLRLIARLTTPTTGTITRPSGPIGYAFQQPNIYPDLSVRENIDVFATLKNADPNRIEELLTTFRLDRVAHRPATALSDGYQKKLDLALAFIGDPPVVLLDEPLADIDDRTATNLIEFLPTDPTTAPIIVIATHNGTRFDDVIDDTTHLHDGTVTDPPPATDHPE